MIDSPTPRAGSKRTFYETVVTIRILSEQPFALENEDDLHVIDNAIADGEVTAWWKKESEETMSGPRMAGFLLAHDMDPAAYSLTNAGEDEEES